MATTTVKTISEWRTFHDNGPFPSNKMLRTKPTPSRDMRSKIKRYNDVAAEIQNLLGQSLATGEGFRALGSTWSLSSIAHHPDQMHDNLLMRLGFEIEPADVHHQSPYLPANLFMFQCGTRIKQVSKFLFDRGKSLKTTGASNGQTIAGCISTGVHGSGLDVGSMQDYVVGLNLIIGPNPDDIVYLERHTRPALTDAYISQFNARVIRNDDLFNAAVLGLGSFGFIHGVVIEAEDLFLLKRYVARMNRDTALRLATTMNFDEVVHSREVDAMGKGLRPYHYKIFANPFNEAEPLVAEMIYKKPYRSDYPDPIPRIQKAFFTDLITLVIRVIEKFPKKIPKLLKRLAKPGAGLFPKPNEGTLGTLAETFWDTQHKGGAFACEFAIDHKDSARALELFSKLTQRHPVPGLYSLRFVKRSEATLAFAKFPISCMIEINGVQWKPRGKIISLQDYLKKMMDELKQNNIDFALHWGKNADWSRPNLVKDMHGARATEWRKMRSALLSPQMCKVFTNDFLTTIGLAEPEPSVPADLIASLGVDGTPVV